MVRKNQFPPDYFQNYVSLNRILLEITFWKGSKFYQNCKSNFVPGQCQIIFFLKSSSFILCFRKVLQCEAYILLVNFYYSIFCFYQIDFMTFSNQIKKFSSHRTTNRISWFSFSHADYYNWTFSNITFLTAK